MRSGVLSWFCKDVCIRYILLWIWWELLRIQRGLDNSSKCWQGANIVLRLVHFHYLLARMFEYATFVWRSSGNCYESSRVWLTHQNVGKMLDIVLPLTILYRLLQPGSWNTTQHFLQWCTFQGVAYPFVHWPFNTSNKYKALRVPELCVNRECADLAIILCQCF